MSNISHDSFEYLKHKLLPKERLGIKAPIWFLTIKSQKSFWFTCVQVACHISLESSWRRLQLLLKLHLNWRFARKNNGPSKLQKSQFREFLDSQLGSCEIKWHLGVAL
jgi:hypothetical protein